MDKADQAPPQSTPHFYRNLSGFTEFRDINNSSYYSPVPDDWFVVISDIVGSTKAIEEGRYKDVNTLGAASISVLQKALGTFHFPFVFGGDGATALIHNKDLEKVKAALLSLKALSKSSFDLDLRVGSICVSEVEDAGHKIEVAKFFMNPQKSIAMMRGGGISWADRKIKEEPEKYCFHEPTEGLKDLEGLSCRWRPMPTQRGKIASILIQPVDSDDGETMQSLLDGINEVFDENLERSCPVSSQNMVYKSLYQCIKDEWKYSDGHLGTEFFKRILSIFICVIAFKLKLPLFFDVETYFSQIFSHSDYRKFDDSLRMILDCSFAEIEKIEALLQDHYNKQKIYFGIHISSHSLMTCLVENTQQGGHIHFIDGGSGGYAMAAKAMKIQIKSDRSSPFKQAN